MAEDYGYTFAGDAFVVDIDGKQHLLVVDSDDDADSPREYESDYSHMYCWHPRYRLGDKHDYYSPMDFLFEIADEYMNVDVIPEDTSLETLFNIVKKSDDIVLLPLYLYDHSGITMSTCDFGDRWDSGQVGWIWCTKKEFDERTASTTNLSEWKRTAMEFLKSEVKDYSNYLEGNTYLYELYELNANGETGEESIECCGGFLGDTYEYNGLLEDFDVVKRVTVSTITHKTLKVS